MNESMEENKTINKKKIIIGILIVGIAISCILAIGNLFIHPTDSFRIEEGKVSVEETAIGYVIRTEKVLNGNNTDKKMVQIKTEGEKVAKNEPVFRYCTENEEKLEKQIEDLDKKISEASKELTNRFSSDIKTLDKEIEINLEKIYKTNNMQEIETYKKNITTAMNKKSRIAGKDSAAGSYLNKLNEQRKGLENELNSGSEKVLASESGIVSYKIDGLEEKLKIDNLKALTEEYLEGLNLKTGQVVSNSTTNGKIVDNVNCYIATIMDKSKTHNISMESRGIKIRLSNSEEISADVEYLSEQPENKVLIVLKVDRQIEELLNYRKISFSLIFSSKQGLKVPNSAIIVDNNLSYVVRNRNGYLDKILVNVIERNDSYSIIRKYKTEELQNLGMSSDQIRNLKSVTLYDEIEANPDITKLK